MASFEDNKSANYNSLSSSSFRDELSINLTDDEVWNMELDIYHLLVPTAPHCPQFTPTSTTDLKVLLEKLEKAVA